MKQAGLKVHAYSVTATWATPRKRCSNHSSKCTGFYALHIITYIHGTAEWAAVLTFLPVAHWYLATFDLCQHSCRDRLAARHASGTPTQALQSETLKNHFKSCAHSSSLRHRAPPPASGLRRASRRCGPPPLGSGYKQFTHLFCSWKWASLAFQEASWRRHSQPAQVRCAIANASVPHSGRARDANTGCTAVLWDQKPLEQFSDNRL